MDHWANIKAFIDKDVAEYYEERAAIGEYERGMTRDDAEAAAFFLAEERRAELARRHLPLALANTENR